MAVRVLEMNQHMGFRDPSGKRKTIAFAVEGLQEDVDLLVHFLLEAIPRGECWKTWVGTSPTGEILLLVRGDGCEELGRRFQRWITADRLSAALGASAKTPMQRQVYACHLGRPAAPGHDRKPLTGSTFPAIDIIAAQIPIGRDMIHGVGNMAGGNLTSAAINYVANPPRYVVVHKLGLLKTTERPRTRNKMRRTPAMVSLMLTKLLPNEPMESYAAVVLSHVNRRPGRTQADYSEYLNRPVSILRQWSDGSEYFNVELEVTQNLYFEFTNDICWIAFEKTGQPSKLIEETCRFFSPEDAERMVQSLPNLYSLGELKSVFGALLKD